jgi:hypothetical protein
MFIRRTPPPVNGAIRRPKLTAIRPPRSACRPACCLVRPGQGTAHRVPHSATRATRASTYPAAEQSPSPKPSLVVLLDTRLPGAAVSIVDGRSATFLAEIRTRQTRLHPIEARSSSGQESPPAGGRDALAAAPLNQMPNLMSSEVIRNERYSLWKTVLLTIYRPVGMFISNQDGAT